MRAGILPPPRPTRKGQPAMRITIVAATGGVGRQALEQAIAAGHDVTAVVRNPGKVPDDVRTVTADLAAAEPAALASAVTDADAVLSCLGPRKKAEYGIVSKGTGVVIDAMRAAGVCRLVVVSGAGVSTVPTPNRPDPPRREPGAGFFNRYLSTPMARLVLGRHFVDVALAEDLLRGSELDWTAVRLPLLTDRPPTGSYRTAYGRDVRGGFSLARADAAHLMLQVIERPEAVRQAIAVAN